MSMPSLNSAAMSTFGTQSATVIASPLPGATESRSKNRLNLSPIFSSSRRGLERKGSPSNHIVHSSAPIQKFVGGYGLFAGASTEVQMCARYMAFEVSTAFG